MKKLIILSITITMACKSYAQQAVIDDAAIALQSMYRSYDSLYNLTFDVKFSYSSDTVLGKFEKEVMEGTYTMARNKAHYKLGNIEFMQNDAYFITLYHDNKILLIDEPKTINIGKQLPFRGIIDSLLQAQSTHYVFSKQNIAGSTDAAFIKLIRQDSTAQFDEFQIKYNYQTNLIDQIVYKYSEPLMLDSTAANLLTNANSAIPLQQKTLLVSFSNYSVQPEAEKLFNYNNYIWFNDEDKCMPVTKYKDYQLIYNKPKTIIRQ